MIVDVKEKRACYIQNSRTYQDDTSTGKKPTVFAYLSCAVWQVGGLAIVVCIAIVGCRHPSEPNYCHAL